MRGLASEEYTSVSKTEEAAGHASRLAVAILDALGDEHCRKMLGSSITRARTVEQIAAETEVPVSTCYRKLRLLVDEGLMIAETIGTKGVGKRRLVYRTSILSAALRFGSGGVGIKVRPNPAAMKRVGAARPLRKSRRRRGHSRRLLYGHRRQGSA